MAEPPDFEQIAREFTERTFPCDVVTIPEPPWKTREQRVDHFTEQLRLIWNARGAADILALRADLEPSDDRAFTVAERIIQKLDR